MPQGRRRRTRELYDHILAAFREHGNNISAVARAAIVDRATAKRAYDTGWPEMEGCGAIKHVLQVDSVLVRAARASTDDPKASAAAAEVVATSPLGKEVARRADELEERARKVLADAQARLEEAEKVSKAKVETADEQIRQRMALVEVEAKQRLAEVLQRAKVDAAETMADEANMAKFGRKAALAAVAITATTLRDVQKIAGDLKLALDGKIATLAPLVAVRLLRELTRLVESSERAVILAMQAERLRVGQPTEVIGIQSLDSSLEEREIRLRALQRSFDKQKAKLTLINGGQPAPVNGSATATGNGVN